MHADSKTINRLIDECFAAKLNAYCPYSRFPVGAAVLCRDGTIFRGTGRLLAVLIFSIHSAETIIEKNTGWPKN